jgi:DNA-binding response OmpR family regulator
MNRYPDSRPPLVAIIDDEEDITTFLGLALEDAGLAVATTNESATALEFLQRERPDVICLDLLMPERMGASLYLAIRRDPDLAATPVLILSGLGARDDLLALLQREGAVTPPTGYIDKPVEPEAFVATIRAQLAAGGRDRPGGES